MSNANLRAILEALKVAQSGGTNLDDLSTLGQGPGGIVNQNSRDAQRIELAGIGDALPSPAPAGGDRVAQDLQLRAALADTAGSEYNNAVAKLTGAGQKQQGNGALSSVLAGILGSLMGGGVGGQSAIATAEKIQMTKLERALAQAESEKEAARALVDLRQRDAGRAFGIIQSGQADILQRFDPETGQYVGLNPRELGELVHPGAGISIDISTPKKLTAAQEALRIKSEDDLLQDMEKSTPNPHQRHEILQRRAALRGVDPKLIPSAQDLIDGGTQKQHEFYAKGWGQKKADNWLTTGEIDLSNPLPSVALDANYEDTLPKAKRQAYRKAAGIIAKNPAMLDRPDSEWLSIVSQDTSWTPEDTGLFKAVQKELEQDAAGISSGGAGAMLRIMRDEVIRGDDYLSLSHDQPAQRDLLAREMAKAFALVDQQSKKAPSAVSAPGPDTVALLQAARAEIDSENPGLKDRNLVKRTKLVNDRYQQKLSKGGK